MSWKNNPAATQVPFKRNLLPTKERGVGGGHFTRAAFETETNESQFSRQDLTKSNMF